MHDPTLSHRETEVLDLAAEGQTDAGIAKKLGITEATVATYWGRVRAKLNAASRTEAVAIHMQEEIDRSKERFQLAYSDVKAQLDRFQSANENSELMHSVFENLPEAVLVVDASFRIVLANQSCANLFGYSENQILHLSVDRLVPRRLQQTHHDHMASFLETPVLHRMGPHVGVPALHKDGSEFTIVADLVPIQHCNEQMTLCMIRNVETEKEPDVNL
jgi:PAS domain S-box-containing protein